MTVLIASMPVLRGFAASWRRGALLAARLEALLAPEWQRLPLWLPVALGAGVLAYFAGRTEPGRGWLWLPWPLLLLAVLLGWRGRRMAAWPVALAGMAALGFALPLWHAGRLPPPLELPSRAVILEGQVDAVEALPQGLRVTLAAPRLDGAEPLPRWLRVRLRANDPLRPIPGDRIRLRALLRAPSAPAYPGAWDFQREAFFKGQGGSGFALGPAERLAESGAPQPFAALRAGIEQRVMAALSGGAGAISAALLTGGQSAIPPADIVAMRDSGLAHLLSVSGLHIAIVMGLGFGVLRFGVALWPWLALRVEGTRLAAPGSLALGGAYLLLTGAQVPMQRSFAMAALVTLGLLVGRRALSLRALAVAVAVVLAFNPASLLGPSFQMSFAAVLVLIAGAEAMAPWLARLRAAPGWWRRPAVLLLGMLATSLLAGIATSPYGLHHFGRLQLYGVVANMVAVPLTSFLVMPAGLVALVLMPLGLEAWALAPMGWGVEAVLLVARGVAAWPGAALQATPMPGWGLLLASAALVWLCLWRARWRLLGLPMLVAGLASGAFVTPPDLLVSADAKLIALRTPAGVVVQKASGGSTFVRDAWLRGWGEDEADTLRDGEAAPPGLDCTPQACRFQPYPEGPVALLLRAPKPRRNETAPPLLAAPHCATGAALLVAAEPIRGRCPGTPWVDRFSVWRDGPHAVWLRPGEAPRVVSDRAWRGARPWVPPPPRPRAAAP
ncbi:ComEC/Rec2 family competence protein [Teichococcus aestuarii]|uniref:ComEC/Rec2 family competence protein n=1 Tax=Teichococcus aestuarii TaxID=568898 RepID=UPI00360C8E76